MCLPARIWHSSSPPRPRRRSSSATSRCERIADCINFAVPAAAFAMRKGRGFGIFLAALHDDAGVMALAVGREGFLVITVVAVAGKILLAARIKVCRLRQIARRWQISDQPRRQVQLVEELGNTRPPHSWRWREYQQ